MASHPTALHAEATGPEDAPAIVFVHGIGAAGWMWWQQVPAFPAHRRLVVDLPGHGRSAGTPWTSLADTAERVAEVIVAQTATGRAHLVGLSLGGHVGLALLEHRPDVVDRAVLSGVTAEPWPNRALLGPLARLTAASFRSRRLLTRRARTLGLPAREQAAFVENALAMSSRTYRRVVAEVAGYAVPAALGAVEAPTLVVAGGRESDAIKRAVERIPAVLPAAAGRVVPGVGHGWNVEAPDAFNATVREWLEEPPPARRP
jgi:pimeloyl-ACP methyl ester carboxylesterase